MNDKHIDSASSGANAQERILSAAGSLFYREGIHATGVERIAQQAGVSKRTMYQHFGSKKLLAAGCLRRRPSTRPAPARATGYWQSSTARRATASVPPPSTTRPSRRPTTCP